jgi:hypothetical protein
MRLHVLQAEAMVVEQVGEEADELEEDGTGDDTDKSENHRTRCQEKETRPAVFQPFHLPLQMDAFMS